MDGGDGDDALIGSTGRDRIEGGDGRNTLDGGADDDTLAGGTGDDVYLGGAGIDTVLFHNAGITVDLSFAGMQNTGAGTDRLVGIENVTTGAGNGASPAAATMCWKAASATTCWMAAGIRPAATRRAFPAPYPPM